MLWAILVILLVLWLLGLIASVGGALANLGLSLAGKVPVNLNFTAGRASVELPSVTGPTGPAPADGLLHEAETSVRSVATVRLIADPAYSTV